MIFGDLFPLNISEDLMTLCSKWFGLDCGHD